MNIIKTNKLDNFTKEKIIDLITICKHHDNINGCIFLEDEINYLPDFPCYIYCLEADKLIGFLSVFIPDDYNCEIYAYVHPDHRKRGTFSSLYKEALHLLHSTSLDNIQIVCEPDSPGEKLLLAKGYSSPVCECMMKYNPSYTPTSHPDYFLIPNENDTYIELSYNNTTLGHCRIDLTNNCATIYDVEIYEQHQGKGYSKILINLILNHIKKSSIVLHVTASNTRALRAYTSCGFDIIEELHFYDVSQ